VTGLDHDGRSGATIERVGGFVVKRSRPGEDVTITATGGVNHEAALWRSGVLDRLPAGVGHAIVDIREEGDTTVTVMRDVGDAVVGWRRMARDEWVRIVDALAAVHRRFAGDDLPGASALRDRVAALSPVTQAPLAGGPNPLPAVVLQGWRRFAELAPPAAVAAVGAVHADPTALVAALAASAPATLLHADAWPVNVALEPDQVVFLDWAIATCGPPALDVAVVLTGVADHIDGTRDDVLDRFRAAAGPDLLPPASIDLALLFGLADMGWNKALDAAGHDDPEQRRRAAADLAWWCDRAGPGIEALSR
jgi:hypothetical protein